MARTLVLPILPCIVVRFQLSGLMIGLLMASIRITSAITAPLTGRLSDRFGRRPILLGCLGISSAGMSMFGLASSVQALFTGRLVDVSVVAVKPLPRRLLQTSRLAPIRRQHSAWSPSPARWD